jgi:hypothetical protein
MGKWTVLNSHNHGLLTESGYAKMKSVKTQYSEVLTDVCAYLVDQHTGMIPLNIDMSINHMRFHISSIFVLYFGNVNDAQSGKLTVKIFPY